MNASYPTTTTLESIAITRQRSHSSDTFPEPKRNRRYETSPSDPSDLTTLSHWRQQQQSLPSSSPSSQIEIEIEQPSQFDFEAALLDLEDNQSVSSTSTSSFGPLGAPQYTSPSSLSDLTQPPPTSSGLSTWASTKNLPTPATTPNFGTSSLQHGTPRPHQHSLLKRSSTLSLPRSGSQGGNVISVSGGQEVASNLPLSESGLPTRRATDGGAPLPPSPISAKEHFATGLVGATVIALESIWGIGSQADSGLAAGASAIPLDWFVKEVLRRSRTSCSTLQVALFYLHKSRREIRDIVARAESARLDRLREQESKMDLGSSYPSPPLSPVDSAEEKFDRFVETQSSPLLCGRRMFLASLISASKYLQDRNYSNRAWSKISGLPVKEINTNERVFLGMMNFQLHLRAEDFQRWTERLGILAKQGAAREMSHAKATSSSTDGPARFGLQRTSSELPETAHTMHDIVAPAPSPSPAVVAPALTRRPSNPLHRSSSLALNGGSHGLMRKAPVSPLAKPLAVTAATLPPTPDATRDFVVPVAARPLRGIPLRSLRSTTSAGTRRTVNVQQYCSADTPSMTAWSTNGGQMALAH